jgi:hypothetical protein
VTDIKAMLDRRRRQRDAFFASLGFGAGCLFCIALALLGG